MLVLYGATMVTTDTLQLLRDRFGGSADPMLLLCDEALRDSVLRAPR